MKNIIFKIIGGLVILILLMNINIVLAASQADINANNKKINEAQNNLEDVKAEKSEATKQVETLTTQISDYQKQIDDLNTQISDLTAKIEEQQTQIEQKETDYTEQEDLLNKRLVAQYEAGDTSYLDVILGSESFTDLISNYYLVTEVASYDTELLEKIQKEKKEIEEAKQQLETNKSNLDTAKATKESTTVQLQTAKKEKSAQVAQLSSEEQKIQEQIEDLKQANIQLDKDIKAAQAKYAQQIADMNNKNNSNNNNNNNSGGSSTGGGSVSSSGFIRPVAGTVTTGMYYSNGSYHGAVDFGSAGINGKPVYAVADGVVITAQALTTSYGNHIIIAHANGLYTLYAHGQAGSIRVSPGQSVSQGQQIMNVGNTGNSFGAHLHFEVRVSPGGYDNRVNPLNYLP